MEIIPRAEAKTLGLKYYFTGIPCKLGHVAKRLTSSYTRADCIKVNNSASARAHYAANREAKLAYGKEYRKKNRAWFTTYMAEWRKNNLERAKETSRVAQAKRRAKGGASSSDVRSWLIKQKKVCHWCGVKCRDDFHMDHYDPLSKGGKHAVANLVIACPKCNMKKSAKDPYEFAASVGRLF